MSLCNTLSVPGCSFEMWAAVALVALKCLQPPERHLRLLLRDTVTYPHKLLAFFLHWQPAWSGSTPGIPQLLQRRRRLCAHRLRESQL